MALFVATLQRSVVAVISAVPVFRRDEIDLHKYCAILAAIEPVRVQLNRKIMKSLNPFRYFIHKLKGPMKLQKMMWCDDTHN